MKLRSPASFRKRLRERRRKKKDRIRDDLERYGRTILRSDEMRRAYQQTHHTRSTVGEHIQIELIQPNGVKSTWQDFLDEHGEGIHHLAFKVKKTDEAIAAMADFAGATVLQHGKYGDGGGEYTYLDTCDQLKCIIELLEDY